MGYNIRLPPPVQRRIKEYVDNLSSVDRTLLIDGIQEGMGRIAENPSVGVMPYKVYDRLTYRHLFMVGDVQCNFQASYFVDDEEEDITIVSFGAIPF